MWHTHAAIGASTLWLLLPFLPSDNSVNMGVLVTCAATGALMPDLDAAESKIRHVKFFDIKPLLPVAIVVNRDFGHRSLLHSARGWAGWTLLVLPLSVITGWIAVSAFSVGYASHLLADACTRTGIPLCYPNRKRFHILPTRLQILTGSASEEALFPWFAFLILVLLFSDIHPQ